MPTNIRAMLSIVTALATGVAFYFESKLEDGYLEWIALILGVVMIGAIWLFPETKERGGHRT